MNFLRKLQLVLILLYSVRGCIQAEPNSAGAANLFEIDDKKCGIYSTYFALVCMHKSVSFSDVELGVRRDADGYTNVSDMIEFLKRNAVTASAMKISIEEIKSINKPFILILNSAADQRADTPNSKKLFHFVFGFYDRSENAFYFADPVADNKLIKSDAKALEQLTTGMALILE